MRALRLFAWWLLGLSLTLLSGMAFAADSYYGSNSGVNGTTALDACKRGAVNGITFTRLIGGSDCYGKVGADEQRYLAVYPRTCYNDEPFFNNDTGRCQAKAVPPVVAPDPCSDKNPIVRRWNYPGAGPYPAPGHFGGCVVDAIEMMVCRKSGTGSYCMWMVKRTGDKYSGVDSPGSGGNDTPEVPADPPVKSPPIESPPKPTDPPGKGPCPAGTVHAGMSASGIPMCIGTGSTPPAKPPQPKTETEKNETGSDGSTTNTKTVITTNTDGSTTKTVTVTVTKADGTKTTSGTADTSATPTGAAGKSDRGPEDDKFDLCKTNPNLSICREGSVTGTCGQIQCVGDAIQCATLRAAAAMECKQRSDEEALKASPLAAKGQAAIDGKDLEGLPNPKNGQFVSLPGLKSESFLGAGAAFEDVSVNIQGQEILVPLSKWSQYLLPFRYMLMVVASLISWRILAGAVLRD
jgi:hypothetical protein